MRRAGFSLLEVLLAGVIFLLAVVPLVLMFTQTNRVGAAAVKVVEATSQGQILIEALQTLHPDELPIPAGATSVVLLEDPDEGTAAAPAPAASEDEDRWAVVQRIFAAERPFPMYRKVTAHRLQYGDYQVTVDYSWLRQAGNESSRYSVRLVGVVSSSGWQG